MESSTAETALSPFATSPSMSFIRTNNSSSERDYSYFGDAANGANRDVKSAALSRPVSLLPARQTREALKFRFSGFSIWLELSSIDNDLNDAITDLAVFEGVSPIPLPHATVLYGITHLTQQQALNIFRDELRTKFGNNSNEKNHWPNLRVKGVLVDRSLDGVDGQNMDMSWTELTLATSPRHENLVDMVFNSFYNDKGQQPVARRIRPWTPHLSLVYDNPHEPNLSLARIFQFVATKFPSLLNVEERRVEAISLWNTNGTMSEWKCLDRIYLA